MLSISCNAVGDILALATLVLDIYRALDDAHGSPAKYRALVSELKSLHVVLASVARIAEHTTDEILRDEIFCEVDRCGGEVRTALERVAKFSLLARNDSTDGAPRVRMKRQYYKLKLLTFREDIADLREEIGRATQRLTIYLVTSNA